MIEQSAYGHSKKRLERQSRVKAHSRVVNKANKILCTQHTGLGRRGTIITAATHNCQNDWISILPRCPSGKTYGSGTDARHHLLSVHLEVHTALSSLFHGSYDSSLFYFHVNIIRIYWDIIEKYYYVWYYMTAKQRRVIFQYFSIILKISKKGHKLLRCNALVFIQVMYRASFCMIR